MNLFLYEFCVKMNEFYVKILQRNKKNKSLWQKGPCQSIFKCHKQKKTQKVPKSFLNY